jgi:hypothetical protein
LVCALAKGGEAMCVSGTGGAAGEGGAAGSGGTAGTGGTAGSGGTAGTGGTGGSGGTAGTGGTGGSGGSGSEEDVAGLPQFSGQPTASPSLVRPDDTLTVGAFVDGDVAEMTAELVGPDSGFQGGSCLATTPGDDLAECELRVETTAELGVNAVQFELRADPLNRLDYVLYRPGDRETYVRIEFENDVPGPETATPWRVVNTTIEF